MDRKERKVKCMYCGREILESDAIKRINVKTFDLKWACKPDYSDRNNIKWIGWCKYVYGKDPNDKFVDDPAVDAFKDIVMDLVDPPARPRKKFSEVVKEILGEK